jgi:cytochrome oxidase assembly protein ShyY1
VAPPPIIGEWTHAMFRNNHIGLRVVWFDLAFQSRTSLQLDLKAEPLALTASGAPFMASRLA